MDLIDIYPKDLICKRVPAKLITFTEYAKESIDTIINLKESCMFELGGTIWDKFIQQNPDVNPMQMAKHFQTSNPYLYREIANFIGEDVIKDILYIHTDTPDEKISYKDFSELLIAVTYPGVLHISDIEFSNPFHPLTPNERQSEFQLFRGLGLFSELISRCDTYCREQNLDKICLTAAHISLLPLFEKNGFTVDDTATGKYGMSIGASIPMTRLV